MLAFVLFLPWTRRKHRLRSFVLMCSCAILGHGSLRRLSARRNREASGTRFEIDASGSAWSFAVLALSSQSSRLMLRILLFCAAVVVSQDIPDGCSTWRCTSRSSPDRKSSVAMRLPPDVWWRSGSSANVANQIRARGSDHRCDLIVMSSSSPLNHC